MTKHSECGNLLKFHTFSYIILKTTAFPYEHF